MPAPPHTCGPQRGGLQHPHSAHQRSLRPQKRPKQRHQLFGSAAPLLHRRPQLMQQPFLAPGGQHCRHYWVGCATTARWQLAEFRAKPRHLLVQALQAATASSDSGAGCAADASIGAAPSFVQFSCWPGRHHGQQLGLKQRVAGGGVMH